MSEIKRFHEPDSFCVVSEHGEGEFVLYEDHAAHVEVLRDALRKCLNYVENTENELGIVLSCGGAARAALEGSIDFVDQILVPKAPTPGMIMSGKGADSFAASLGEDWDTRVGDIYRAMTKAASKPTA